MLKYRFVADESKSAFAIGMVQEKQFSTGSDGFYSNGKVALPAKFESITFELKDGDDVVAAFMLPKKSFSTGSTGYWNGGKMALETGMYQLQVSLIGIGSKTGKWDGRSCQMSVQLVRIGSKDAPKPVVESPIAADVAAANAAIDALTL